MNPIIGQLEGTQARRMTAEQRITAAADAMLTTLDLKNLTARPVRAIIRTAEGFSETNCGWSSYAIRAIVLETARDWKRHGRRWRASAKRVAETPREAR